MTNRNTIFSALTALLCTMLCASTMQAQDVDLQAKISGPVEDLSNSQFRPCTKRDIPDTPLRAVRMDGEVLAYSSHYVAYVSSGTDLENLKKDCSRPIYSSGNPNAFSEISDYTWIISVFAANQHLYALAHNEFHGNEHPGACTSTSLQHCWLNTISELASRDNRSFPVISASDLVAADLKDLPLDLKHPTGYFNPTNVLKSGRYYFFAAHVLEDEKQPYGVCVFRTDHPGQASSWQAWDGQSYSVSMVTRAGAEQHVCAPVSRAALGNISPTGIYYWRTKNIYIMLGSKAEDTGSKKRWSIYASLSRDLTNWSQATSLLDKDDSELLGYAGYPSMLDPQKGGLNFDEVTDTPYLFFVHTITPDDRRVMRVRINLSSRGK